jgi:hypothetical protein
MMLFCGRSTLPDDFFVLRNQGAVCSACVKAVREASEASEPRAPANSAVAAVPLRIKLHFAAQLITNVV